MPLDLTSGKNKYINGKLYTWQPDYSSRDTARYLGQDDPEIDETPDVGPGSWVPADPNVDGNGGVPWWMLAGMIGGPAVAAGISSLVGLAGGAGAAGGTGATIGTGSTEVASTVAPSIAGGAAAAAPGIAPATVAPFAAAPAAFSAPAASNAALIGGTPSATMGAAPAAGVGNYATATGGTLGKIGNLTRLGGNAISGATKASAANRGLTDDFNQRNSELGLSYDRILGEAANTNITGQRSIEDELINRAKLENDQRQQGLKDMYRSNYFHNPAVSPYNPRPQTFSPEFLAAMQNMSNQGADKVSTPMQYDTRNLPAIEPYKPYTPPPFTPPAQSKPGTMEKAGNWLGPTLSLIGSWFGK